MNWIWDGDDAPFGGTPVRIGAWAYAETLAEGIKKWLSRSERATEEMPSTENVSLLVPPQVDAGRVRNDGDASSERGTPAKDREIDAHRPRRSDTEDDHAVVEVEAGDEALRPAPRKFQRESVSLAILSVPARQRVCALSAVRNLRSYDHERPSVKRVLVRALRKSIHEQWPVPEIRPT